ncbi:M48 family metallopeptidase [Cognatishimia maritima]|uniref:YgjP-like metallopeptidase domain-containing protein n=1 Tax=Cognatishimia maritima TaxID=870908 RepID=A0A1M5REJ5_9RHOB|nr:SprT family zinc-dependent metalloprotease [Cognatishimia maritima]SHH24449.1 hypothetical protein SAMN04488044_2170 [Cognatishimia maritima]
MTLHFLPGEPEIAVHLRRNARARRISLRVSRLDGKVTLTLPNRLPENEGLAFARQKESWIRKQLAERPEQVCVTVGDSLPFQGDLLDIVASAAVRVCVQGEQLCVPHGMAEVGPKVERFLKAEARARLKEAADHYAGALGVDYTKLTLRDTRSRWGSCTSERGLMFSWRLIMAPAEVLRYVAAHEVAHLVEMNHSPAFWSVVDQIYGPHQMERNWLKQHGEKLHRFRF